MPDTTVETNGRAARQDRPDDPASRVAELEAEVAALRRALAEAGRGAETGPAAPPIAGSVWARLLEAAPHPYLVLRPDAPRFTVAAASDAYLRATMTRRQDVVGRGVIEAFPDDPADPAADGVRNLRTSLERVLASRAPDRMPVQKYDVRRPDGAFEERHWSPFNAPVIGAEGRVEAILHHVEDVTEAVRLREGAAADRAETREARSRAGMMEAEALRQAREAARANAELGAANASLREREERLRLILDSATEYAIFATDLERRVTSWNAGAERLLGWAEAEIVDRSADAIFTPEDRAAGAPQREAGGALRDGRAANERWHQRKDGSRFWASGLVMPLRGPGADPGAPPLGLIKVMRDRTAERRAEEALREAEDHLRHTVELNPQIPWTAEPDGRIAGFNDRWLEVTGLTREETLGEGWTRVPHPDDLPRMAAAWESSVSTGRPYDVEARLRMADGSHRWWRARAFPRRDAAGRVVRWYGTTEDIHDRKAAEAARREGERRLRLLADTAAGLLAATDPDEVLAPVFRSLSEGFGVDVSFCYVSDEERGGEGLRLSSCFGVPEEARAGFGRLALGEGVCGRAARTRCPVHVTDVETFDDPAAPGLRALGVRAYVSFPLCSGGGRLLGTLSFGSRGRDRFSEDELAFLGTIAHHVAVVRERLRAEAALREGEARWRGVFERMEQGFALAEMVHGPGGEAVDYRFLEVNDAWVRHTGVPRVEAVGRPITEVLAPDEAAFWIGTYARVAETGEPARVEHYVPSFRRWFEWVGWRTEPGRVAALVVDATERKAAEARRDALVELGDRLRDLRDPAGIAHAAAEVIGKALGALRAGYARVDADEDGICIERDWTGGPEVAGIAGPHRLSDYWAPGLVADLRRGQVVVISDVARDPRTAPHLASFAALGIRSCVHVPVVEAGRLAALLYVHAAEVRDWTGEEVAFVRGVADRAWAAAERARAEEGLRAANEASRAGEARLRLALEAGRLGAWELDLATDTSVRTPRHAAIFGHTLPTPGWGFGAFLRRVLPEDRDRAERSFRAAADGDADEWRCECRIRRADGAVRWIEASARPSCGADGRPVRLFGVTADITERKRAEERRALLVAELNHRVKNSLAVVQSLALQTARGAADLPAFSAAFQARLMALARAHDLLTRESWEGAPLAEAVRAALEPSAGGDAGRVDLGACASGALLPPAQALALAMALHELAANALKHGALSVPDGRVAVACRVDPEGGAAVVEWAERGGPPVPGPPARKGFGLRLLERGLAAQAGMRADIRFEPEGLRCTLRLPPPANTAPRGP